MPQPLPPVPATATLTYMRSKVSEADAMFRQGLGNLSQPSDMIRLASRLLDLCNDVSDHLNHLCIVKPVACRNGCDTCCRSLIQVNPIFAHLALDHAQPSCTKQYTSYGMIGRPACIILTTCRLLRSNCPVLECVSELSRRLSGPKVHREYRHRE